MKIEISDLTFNCIIGILDFERIKKQKVKIEKWLIEENDIKFVVETSDIDSWLKSFPTAQKLKLIESYKVEI